VRGSRNTAIQLHRHLFQGVAACRCRANQSIDQLREGDAIVGGGFRQQALWSEAGHCVDFQKIWPALAIDDEIQSGKIPATNRLMRPPREGLNLSANLWREI